MATESQGRSSSDLGKVAVIPTVLERLSFFAEHQPNKDVFKFYDSHCRLIQSLSFDQLDKYSTVLACRLRKSKFRLQPGDCVLLVYPPSLDFIVAFLACMKANLISVPVVPPDPTQARLNLRSFIGIQRNSGAQVALTSSTYAWARRFGGVKQAFSRGGEDWPELTWIQTDKLLTSDAKTLLRLRTQWPAPSILRNDVAFLQYTSGSTSDPKGVMITHDMLAHNLYLVVQGVQLDTSTVNVTWLPVFHDLGLVVGMLSQLACGGTSHCMSPITFLRSPTLWLRLISQVRATATTAPNFAFALVLRKWRALPERDRQDLDLSSLIRCCSAAEPISCKVMETFFNEFAPLGLKRSALTVGYGLAEHTVNTLMGPYVPITVDRVALQTQQRVIVLDAASITQATNPMQVASSGCSFPGSQVDVRIVNPDTCQELPADRVGEVWVTSPSKSSAYWKQPELSQVTFHATLAGDAAASDNQVRYLRTGDLAFAHDGQLFICGRLKDLLIIRGRNVFPQDIERTAELDDRIRPGCSVVFSAPQPAEGVAAESDEQLVLVCEVRDDSEVGARQYEEIERQIRVNVAEQCEVLLSLVVFVAPRSVLKTTSGKVSRQPCKRAFAEGRLSLVYRGEELTAPVVPMPMHIPPASPTQREVPKILLHVDDVQGHEKVESALSSSVLFNSRGTTPRSDMTSRSTVTPPTHDSDDDDDIVDSLHNYQATVRLISVVVSKELEMSAADVDIHTPLAAFGIDSARAVTLVASLSAEVGYELPVTLLFECSSIHALAERLMSLKHSNALTDLPLSTASSVSHRKQVAIIGIGCYLPGARNAEEYWRLLVQNEDHVRTVPESRTELWQSLAEEDVATMREKNASVLQGGWLPDISGFDANFFKVSVREATNMDPQQRLVLQTIYHAFEDAGLPVGDKRRHYGVFIGSENSDFAHMQVACHAARTNVADDPQSAAFRLTGSSMSVIAGRVAYVLNLTGPTWVVDTACSSSMVAIHSAYRAVMNGDCDVAVAGGVNMINSLKMSTTLHKAGFLSPDGRCKSFDASANGYVRGEGLGFVVLKTLEAAERDGDRIYAVMCGSAVNQDGTSQGLSAPNQQSQEEVLSRAYRDAGISPSNLTFVEAHGTGTALGDVIECASLSNVLSRATPPQRDAILLGSAKTNIGHLEAASGVAGLIKAALALYHGQLPASLHCHTLNPKLSLGGRFRIATKNTDLPSHVLAGVTSFGFSGTNSHVVLTSGHRVKTGAQSHIAVTDTVASTRERGAQVFMVSAKSVPALRELANAYATLVSSDTIDIAELSMAILSRRAPLAYRLALPVLASENLVDRLRKFHADGLASPLAAVGNGTSLASVAFVLSGQGRVSSVSHVQNLCAAFAVFRQTYHECCDVFRTHDIQLHAHVVADDVSASGFEQHLLFAVQLSLAALLRSLGVKAAFVVGHSVGEVAAAVICGALSTAEGVGLIVLRSALLKRLYGSGCMVAIKTTTAALNELLSGAGVRNLPDASATHIGEAEAWAALAAENSEQGIVVSCNQNGFRLLSEWLQKRSVVFKRLPVEVAFHSPAVAQLKDEFMRGASECLQADARPKTGGLTFCSSTFACVLRPEQQSVLRTADYWYANMRQTVQFKAACELVLTEGATVVLELGHGALLTAAVQQVAQPSGQSGSQKPRVMALAALNHNADVSAEQSFAITMAQLYAANAVVARMPKRTPFVDLPKYPFHANQIILPFTLHTAFRARLSANPQDPTEMADGAMSAITGQMGAADEEESTTLEQLWRDILVLPSDQAVPLDSSWTDAGGDSLGAAQLFAVLGPLLSGDLQLADVLSMTRRQMQDRLGGVELAVQSLPPALDQLEGPASPAQCRIFFHTQALQAENPSAYWLPFTIQLDCLPGQSVSANLERATRVVRLIAERHASLRTTLQLSLDTGSVMQRVLDVSALPAVELLPEGSDYVQWLDSAYKTLPVVGSGQPLVRWGIIPGEKISALLLLHHCIVDGVSMASLGVEVAALWADERAQLLPLSATFMDWSAWDNMRVSQLDDYCEAMQFWKEYLHDAQPLRFAWGMAPRRDEAPGRHPVVVHWRCTEDERAMLRNLAQLTLVKEDNVSEASTTAASSEFSVMVAVVLAALDRFAEVTGAASVLSSVNGRDHAAVQSPLVGCFVSTVLYRARTAMPVTGLGSPEGKKWLAECVRDQLSAQQHSWVPIEELSRRLHLPKSDATSKTAMPLTSVLLSADQWKPAEEVDVLMYDLDILWKTEAGELVLCTPPDSKTWSENRLNALVDVCRELLQPSTPKLIELISSENVQLEVLAGECIGQRLKHAWFENPSRPALSHGDTTLTYAQMSVCVAALATRVNTALQGALHQRVGVCLDRSIQLPLVIAALWASGHSYVAFSASHPRERLEKIAALTEVSLVVTDASRDWWRTVHSNVLFVDDADIDAVASSTSADIPVPVVDLEVEAFIITTSGSTGEPKAISTAQRALVCLLDGLRHSGITCTNSDVMLLASSSSFDAHILQIAMALEAGAHLICITQEELLDVAQLAAVMTHHGVTRAEFTPSLLNILLAPGVPFGETLRMIEVGGEAASIQLMNECRKRWPRAEMLNIYGPAECCIDTTTFLVPLSLAPAWYESYTSSMPIGFAPAGYQTRIVNSIGQPVPRGVKGELWIGGRGLMSGYVGRPDLTEQAMVMDEQGEHWYRSGDLVYTLEHHPFALVYAGRRDTQVKLRGQRVELSEVEAVVAACTVVRQAVILKDSRREQLVAFVIAAGDVAHDIVEAQSLAACRAKLPQFMVPWHVYCVSEFPTTPASKLDSGALLALSNSNTVSASSAVELSDVPVSQWLSIERALREQLMALLAMDIFSRDADFFTDLGGHSLLAVRYLNQLRQEGVCTVLPLSSLFRFTTIRTLAQRVMELNDAAGTPSTAAEANSGLPDVQSDNLATALPAAPVPRKSAFSFHVAQTLSVMMLLLLQAAIAGGFAIAGGIASRLAAPLDPHLQIFIFALVTFGGGLLGNAIAAIVLVRLLGVGVGAYPRYSAAHLRLWFADRVFACSRIVWRLCSGSSLLPLVLRLMGAEVHQSAVISSVDLQALRCVRIGARADVQPRVAVRPVRWSAQYFEIISVNIGEECSIGAGSVLEAGAALGARCVVDDRTLVNTRVPDDHQVSGCPTVIAPRQEAHVASRAATLSALLPIALYVLQVGAVAAATVAFYVALMFHWALAAFAVPCIALVGVALTAVMIAFVLGRLPARLRVYLWRQWAFVLDVWGFTLWNKLVLRAAGWTLGEHAEVAGPIADYWLSPAPVQLETCATTASNVQLGSLYDEQPVIVPRGVFVGNDSAIVRSAALSDFDIVGSCCAATTSEQAHSDTTPSAGSVYSHRWLGNPCTEGALHMLVSSTPSIPTQSMIRRILCEALVLTGSMFALWLSFFASLTVAFIASDAVPLHLAWLVRVAVLVVLVPIVISVVVIAMKWTIMQRFEEAAHEMWDAWFFRRMMCYLLFAAWRTFCGHLFAGSPLATLFWRAIGAKIAWSAQVEATMLLEPDLLTIGEGAVVDGNALLQPHTFEYRRLAMRAVEIEQDAVLGSASVVLAGARIGEGVHVAPLSLVLKGDELSCAISVRWCGALLQPESTVGASATVLVPKARVAVTGAAGFIASQLIKQLLEAGYVVHGTVRNLKQTRHYRHLTALPGADRRLKLFESDLLNEGSFAAAFAGCVGVFHTASPVIMDARVITDAQKQIIAPAVQGTQNVLKCAVAAATVKRVILTSSIAAIYDGRQPSSPYYVFSEKDWSDLQWLEQVKQWYAISKTLAERAAWDVVNAPGFTAFSLVAINPPVVLGPMLQPTINESSGVIAGVLEGSNPVIPNTVWNFIDVRDVASAHIVAFENQAVTGRVLLGDQEWARPASATYRLLGELFPEHRDKIATKLSPGLPVKALRFSLQKARSYKMPQRPVRDSVLETVKSLRERGVLVPGANVAKL